MSDKEINLFILNKKKIKVKKSIIPSSKLVKIGIDKYKTHLFLK